MHTALENKLVRLAVAAIVFAAAAAGAPVNVCALLSPDVIHQATNEAATGNKASTQTVGKVRYAQCFYTLPTFTNSISLTLTSPVGLPRDSARELWERSFHQREESEKDGRHKEPEPKGEEEEAAARATPVAGIGDEAFWVHSFVGNLYVRKGNQFLRISLGGKGTDEERQARAKKLATEALRRLH